MVVLRLGDRADPVDEFDRVDPVLDLERLDQLLVVFDAPAIELCRKRGNLVTGQWRRPAAAWDAPVVGKTRRHQSSLPCLRAGAAWGLSTLAIVARSAS